MLGSIIFGAGRACGAPFYYIPVPSCLWEWRGGGMGGGLLLEGCEGCARACGAALRLLRGQGSESCVSGVFVVCVWCVLCDGEWHEWGCCAVWMWQGGDLA